MKNKNIRVRRKNLNKNEDFRFEEYIEHLKENFLNLVEYRERTGTLENSVLQIKEALFNDDPFIVFGASLAASVVLTDKSLYH